MTKDLLQCALGVHRYDKKIKPNCFLCSICKRARYCKYPNGFECQSEYDEKGREIYYKDSRGFECWYEYDEKSRRTYYKDSTGFEKCTKYNEEVNIISQIDSNWTR